MLVHPDRYAMPSLTSSLHSRLAGNRQETQKVEQGGGDLAYAIHSLPYVLAHSGFSLPLLLWMDKLRSQQ